MNIIISSEIFRFVIVGLVNTLNYYIIYLLLNNLIGIPYIAAHLIAFIISMIGSFYLNSYYTYRVKPTFKKFIKFPLTYLVNVTISTLTIIIFVDLLGFNDDISPILAQLCTIPFTFIVSKMILKNEGSNN